MSRVLSEAEFRASLQRAYGRLECLEAHRVAGDDPNHAKLNLLRGSAHGTLNNAVALAIKRVGVSEMHDLMDEVDFRGW